MEALAGTAAASLPALPSHQPRSRLAPQSLALPAAARAAGPPRRRSRWRRRRQDDAQAGVTPNGSPVIKVTPAASRAVERGEIKAKGFMVGY